MQDDVSAKNGDIAARAELLNTEAGEEAKIACTVLAFL